MNIAEPPLKLMNDMRVPLSYNNDTEYLASLFHLDNAITVTTKTMKDVFLHQATHMDLTVLEFLATYFSQPLPTIAFFL